MSNSSDKYTLASYTCRVCFDKNLVGGIDLTKDENMLKLFEFCVGISVSKF